MPNPTPLLRKIIFRIFLLLILGSTAFVQTSRLNVRDLGRSTELIGVLGEPLGTELRVRGKWDFPSEREKDSSVRLSIESVNDRELNPPVVFFIAQLNITEDGKHRLPLVDMQLEGQEWDMIAYETGELWVHTNLYPEDHIPDDPNTVLAFTTSATWQSYFTPMLVARKIDKSGPKERTNNEVKPSR